MSQHDIPNPHGTVNGRPYVPLQSVNSGKIRLCRYQAGMLMIELKGRGVNITEAWLMKTLRDKFDEESAKPADKKVGH